MLSLIFTVILLTAVSYGNLLIGRKDLRSNLGGLSRGVIYGLFGFVMALFSAYLIPSVGTFFYILLVTPLGYMLYRQPGPDIAFYAGHVRNYFKGNGYADVEHLPEWYNWFLKPILGEDVNYIIEKGTKEDLIKLGIYGGAIRGAFLLGLGIIMCYIHWSGLIFSLLGLTFGLIHYIMGVEGPFKTEVGMRDRATLASGVLVGLTVIGPMLIKSF